MIASVKPLVQRFNEATRQAMEGAAGLCLSRTHYEVEIEHFITKPLENDSGDVARILEHFGVDRDSLAHDLERSLRRLKTGNPRSPVFSPSLVSSRFRPTSRPNARPPQFVRCSTRTIGARTNRRIFSPGSMR